MFKVVISLRDGSGDRVSRTFTLKTTAYADAITAAQTLKDNLAAITGMSVVSLVLKELLEFPYTPNTTSKAEYAVIVADGSPSGKKYSFNVPAPLDAVFGAPGTPSFDEVQPVVGITDYLASIATLCKVSDGESLTGLTFSSGRRIE